MIPPSGSCWNVNLSIETVLNFQLITPKSYYIMNYLFNHVLFLFESNKITLSAWKQG